MDLIPGSFFFWLKHSNIPLVSKADIGHIALSGNALILLELLIHKSQPKTPTWRINEALLKDPTIAVDVLQELSTFFTNNVDSVGNPLSVWSAHKCFVRGILIKHGYLAKQKWVKTLSNLLAQLHVLENKHKNGTDCTIEADLLKV